MAILSCCPWTLGCGINTLPQNCIHICWNTKVLVPLDEWIGCEIKVAQCQDPFSDMSGTKSEFGSKFPVSWIVPHLHQKKASKAIRGEGVWHRISGSSNTLRLSGPLSQHWVHYSISELVHLLLRKKEKVLEFFLGEHVWELVFADHPGPKRVL